jgi:hypothetical protein
MMEDEPTAEQAANMIAESYMRLAVHAADIAYSRRTLYEAYLSEGFTPEESLDLCKIL